jgi:hypothetical protein
VIEKEYTVYTVPDFLNASAPAPFVVEVFANYPR